MGTIAEHSSKNMIVYKSLYPWVISRTWFCFSRHLCQHHMRDVTQSRVMYASHSRTYYLVVVEDHAPADAVADAAEAPADAPPARAANISESSSDVNKDCSQAVCEWSGRDVTPSLCAVAVRQVLASRASAWAGDPSNEVSNGRAHAYFLPAIFVEACQCPCTTRQQPGVVFC